MPAGAEEAVKQAGERSVRGTSPTSRWDSHPPAPAPQLASPPMQTTFQPPPTPIVSTPAPAQSPQPVSGSLPMPPRTGPSAGGIESQAIVQADVRGASIPPPRPPEEPPLLAALRCYREGRKDEAHRHLQKFAPSTRELLDCLLAMAVRLSNVNLDKVPPRELSALVQEFDALAQIVRPRAGLEITEVRFCQRIHRFGDYDPLPVDHAFQSGAGDRPGDFVQVYVELRNFTCLKRGPFYETALASSVTIRDANQRVFTIGRPAQVDRLLSRRLDCFLNCHFYVPPGLPAGEYKLVVEVKDVTGLPDEHRVPAQRVAERVVPFRISGPAYASRRWDSTDGAGPEEVR